MSTMVRHVMLPHTAPVPSQQVPRGERARVRRAKRRFEENKGGPKEAGLNIGQHEGLSM